MITNESSISRRATTKSHSCCRTDRGFNDTTADGRQRQKRMKRFTSGQSIVPQFYGDTSTVNGRHGPDCPSIPNSTGSACSAVPAADTTTSSCSGIRRGIGRHRVRQGRRSSRSGTTAGSSRNRSETADRLELGSSQRADVVVDFSEYAGETLLLHNNAPAKYRRDERNRAGRLRTPPGGHAYRRGSRGRRAGASATPRRTGRRSPKFRSSPSTPGASSRSPDKRTSTIGPSTHSGLATKDRVRTHGPGHRTPTLGDTGSGVSRQLHGDVPPDTSPPRSLPGVGTAVGC